MRVETKGPSDIGNFWFKCSRTIEITEPDTTPELTIVTEVQNTAVTVAVSYTYLNILLALLVYFRGMVVVY